MKYDVVVIGAGPGGIFAAYELMRRKPELKVAVFEAGHALNRRSCPIGGEGTKLYSTAGTRFKTLCIQNDLHLLDASVRHLGTDINYVVMENLYAWLQDKVQFFFDTPVQSVAAALPTLCPTLPPAVFTLKEISQADRKRAPGDNPGARL